MLSSSSEQPLQLFEPVEDDVQLPLSQDRCLVVERGQHKALTVRCDMKLVSESGARRKSKERSRRSRCEFGSRIHVHAHGPVVGLVEELAAVR